MNCVLLIDDDLELCGLLQRFLHGEGFRVDTAPNGPDGIAQLKRCDYALILLDVMMPEMDGLEVLRRVRATSRIPVLMLTAKGDTRDRVRGLELGADDYLSKPFDPAELAARIRAILRRTSPSEAHASVLSLSVGNLELNAGTRSLRRDGEPVELTTVEFDLLAVLMRAAGTPVSREQLCREVLGREFSPFDRSIDTHVYNLRKKIGMERIKGVRGTGYLCIREAS